MGELSCHFVPVSRCGHASGTQAAQTAHWLTRNGSNDGRRARGDFGGDPGLLVTLPDLVAASRKLCEAAGVDEPALDMVQQLRHLEAGSGVEVDFHSRHPEELDGGFHVLCSGRVQAGGDEHSCEGRVRAVRFGEMGWIDEGAHLRLAGWGITVRTIARSSLVFVNTYGRS